MEFEIDRFLRIPTPVDLGMSKYNALGIREFTPFQEGPMWEDYYEIIKRKYPIRYFLAYVVWKWLSLRLYILKRRCGDFKHKYILRSHLLDVRGVDPHETYYEYGYNDPCYIMWIMGWKALRQHVEEDQPKDPADIYSEEDKQHESYQAHKAAYDEIMALYHYWMVERKEISDECDRLWTIHKEDGERGDKAAYDASGEVWRTQHKRREELEEEMFLRLAKVRPYMWR